MTRPVGSGSSMWRVRVSAWAIPGLAGAACATRRPGVTAKANPIAVRRTPASWSANEERTRCLTRPNRELPSRRRRVRRRFGRCPGRDVASRRHDRPLRASAGFRTLPASTPESCDAATSTVGGDATAAMNTARGNPASARASGRTSSSDPVSRRTMATRTPAVVEAAESYSARAS